MIFFLFPHSYKAWPPLYGVIFLDGTPHFRVLNFPTEPPLLLAVYHNSLWDETIYLPLLLTAYHTFAQDAPASQIWQVLLRADQAPWNCAQRGPFLYLGFLFLFFLACGALGNLGFGLIHSGQSFGLIGASGGVSGLAAGAARIVGGEGGIGGLRSPFVISMGGAWILSNLIVAVTGGALMEGGAQIAWEAHLAGFAAGLVLLRPFARLAGALSR